VAVSALFSAVVKVAPSMVSFSSAPTTASRAAKIEPPSGLPRNTWLPSSVVSKAMSRPVC
jgi:hypothetical protein